MGEGWGEGWRARKHVQLIDVRTLKIPIAAL